MRLTAPGFVQQRTMAFAHASFLRKPNIKPHLRAKQSAEARQEAVERWLPADKGNLKRLRSGAGHKMTPKSRRQQARTSKPVYATRSQLRKLKKIMPDHFDFKRRTNAFVPYRKGKVVNRN